MQNRITKYFLGEAFNNGGSNATFESALASVTKRRDNFLKENSKGIEIIDERLEFHTSQVNGNLSYIFGIITLSYYQK